MFAPLTIIWRNFELFMPIMAEQTLFLVYRLLSDSIFSVPNRLVHCSVENGLLLSNMIKGIEIYPFFVIKFCRTNDCIVEDHTSVLNASSHIFLNSSVVPRIGLLGLTVHKVRYTCRILVVLGYQIASSSPR